MKYELPIFYEDLNYGSQYQNYFLSMSLWDEDNFQYLYLYYLMLTAKHFHDCHIDYSFDGAVASDSSLLEKYIIYGRIENLTSEIILAIKKGAYVILNVNERFLPEREAYQLFDFRHDLLIYGYDEDRNVFMTLGFDGNFHYRQIEYASEIVEKAYYGMENEWDYDISFYKGKKNDCMDKIELKKEILYLLELYLSGGSYCKKKLHDFLDGSKNQIWLCNESFYGFHGIQVYEYLIKRIGCFASVFKGIEIGDASLGVADIRSFHVMISHKHVLLKMLSDRRVVDQETMQEDIKKNIKNLADRLTECKMLLIYIVHGTGGRKEGKRILSILKKCQADEYNVMKQILCILHI